MGQGLGIAWSAFIHSIAGNVTETENDGRASLALLEDTGLSGPSLGALVAVGWALIERGELDEAEALLAAAPEPVGWGASALACVRAQLLIARHRYAEALVEIAPVEQLAAGRAHPGAALVARARGDRVARHRRPRRGDAARAGRSRRGAAFRIAAPDRSRPARARPRRGVTSRRSSSRSRPCAPRARVSSSRTRSSSTVPRCAAPASARPRASRCSRGSSSQRHAVRRRSSRPRAPSSAPPGRVRAAWCGAASTR